MKLYKTTVCGGITPSNVCICTLPGDYTTESALDPIGTNNNVSLVRSTVVESDDLERRVDRR